MNVKMRKNMLLLSLAVPLSLPLWATAADQAPATPSPEVKTATDKGPPPSPEMLAKEAQKRFYPPAISEIFDSAEKNKLTGNWKGKIKVASQDYQAMEVPRRAFQVGVALADVAFLVLDNKTAPPSADLVNLANDAISSITPPQEVQSEVQKLRDQYKSGSLQGKELVSEITRLINEVVPMITETTDPTMRDTGELLMTAGYFKALYLGAETLANSPSPTPAQLELVQAWKDIAEHSLDYLGKQTSPTFKDSVQVKNLVVALVKINPLLGKARGQLTKEDVAQIAAALKPLFG